MRGLTLSPDGTRLVTAVQTLNPKRTKWVTALWEVDPAGERPARRLTRSAKGEGGAAFLPDGSLLFTSRAPGPGRRGRRRRGRRCSGCCPPAAARPAWSRTGPAASTTSRSRPTPAPSCSPRTTFPSSDSDEAEAAKRKERKEKKVSAILHEQRAGAVLGPRPRPRRSRACSPAPWPTPRDPGDEPEAGPDRPDAGARAGRSSRGSTPSAPTARPWSPPGRCASAGGQRYALALIDVASGDLTGRRSTTPRASTTARASAPTAGRSPWSARSARRRTTRATGGSCLYSPRRRVRPRPHRRLGPLARELAGVDAGRFGARARRPTRTAAPRCSGSTSPAASSPG